MQQAYGILEHFLRVKLLELVDIFFIIVIVAIGHNVDTDNPCLDVFRERWPRNLQDTKNIFSKHMGLASLL